MKNIFKRTVAMLLLLVMVLGILPSDLSMAFAATTATPTEATQNLLTSSGHNSDFQTSKDGDPSKPANWTEFYTNRNWSSYTLIQRATGDLALKYTVTSDGIDSGASGTLATNALYSEPIDVQSYVGKNLMLNVDTKIASGTPGLQFFLCFYTNTDKPTAIESVGVTGRGAFNMNSLITDEWATASTSQLSRDRTFVVPEGAKYARVFMYFNCKNVGEIYIDNVVLKAVCADDAHTYTKGNVSNAIYRNTLCETRYYKRCDNCDFIPYLPTVGVEAGTAVGRYAHALTAVPHKAATANATGNIAYWVCGNCSKWFEDDKALVEIKDHDDVIIAKRFQNLLADYDPSFENTAVGEDPAGWTPALAGSENYYEVTDKYATKGSKSLKLFIDETAPNSKGLFSPVIPIADIKALSVMADVRGDAEATIWVYFYDASMNEIPFSKDVVQWFAANAQDKWETVFRKYTVPENARYVKLLLYKPKTTEGTVYIDNVILKEYDKADEPAMAYAYTDSFEDGAAANGLPKGWTSVNSYLGGYTEIADYATTDKPANAPATNVDGTHVLKFSHETDSGVVRGLYSPYIDVSAMSAVTASALIFGEGALAVHILFYDENYHKPDGSDWQIFTTDEYLDDWGQIEFNANVPAGAKYARLCLYKSTGIHFAGTTYIDKVELKESAIGKNQVQPDVPEYVEYDWEIIETEHPRVYFNERELRRIKKATRNENINSMGYTGASAYTELMAEADGYMAENYFYHVFIGYRVVVQLYPKLEDMSVSEQYTRPPSSAFSMPYPYSTRINYELRNRMKTLSLAYLLSGDQKYADRAIQYALDMCEWQYWEAELFTKHLYENYGEYSNQGLGYCVSAVSAVYDMCYDLLTPEQRAKMENAIIEKGLECLYNDSLSRMTRGKDLDESANLYIGVCAIINEDNKDQLAKYLDRAMQYTNWIFTWYENGHNEGFSYGCTALDQMFAALATLERVTGSTGMLEHPFASEILPMWIKGFIETGNGTMTGYRDSPYGVYFPIVLSTLALRGDTEAGFLLHLNGGADNPFEKLVYTNISDDYIWPIEDDAMNVVVLETMGIGSLRTGWGDSDKLLVLYADDYPYAHTHWESNSIFFAMDGEWLIRDMGYGSITEGDPRTTYDMKYAINTVFVDNKPQTVKDAGTISEIFNTELYGQIRGSAPGAYGKIGDTPVLDRFDRDVVMFNHDSTSYYVVIDDLASSKEHIYGWNMFHLAWERIELDNKEWNYETTNANHFAMLKAGKVLHQYFVGNPLTFSSEEFTKVGATYGPLFRANTQTASKNHQFMVVINAEHEYDGITTIDSSYLLRAYTSKTTNDNPDGFSWSSSHKLEQVIARPLADSGYKATMFRAHAEGDWMSYPFYVEKGGKYEVSIKVLYWYTYGGTWQIYMDGQPVGEPVQPRSLVNGFVEIPFGEMEVSEGKHMIKVELIGDPDPEGEEWGTLIGMGEIVMKEKGASLGNGSVEVLESYDDENLIAATIRYGNVLKDMILSNKGTGAVTAGKLSTNGKQAAILGLYEDKINEGYSMLNGTSLKYGDLTLVTASTAMDVTVDFRLSRYPVKNNDDDEAYQAIIEEFNFNKLTTKLSVTAQEAGTLTFHVGTDAPYTVTINDQAIPATYADGMLTVDVAAGTHNLVIVGTHHCVYDQHATLIPNVKEWAGCFNPTEYYVSCLCGANGTETFFDGEPRGHEIGLVKAKDPTDTEDGWIEHYGCKNCDAVFADKDGKQPLTWEDVVIRHPVNYMWIVWVAVGVVALAGIATATLLILKYKFGIVLFKKKEAAPDQEQDQPAEES